MDKSAYQKYIESDTWENKRQERLDFANDRCELCYCPTDLQVHHRTYERFGGDEKVEDLIVLCSTCHYNFHKRLSLHDSATKFPEGVPQENPTVSSERAVKDTLEYLEEVHGEDGGITGVPAVSQNSMHSQAAGSRRTSSLLRRGPQWARQPLRLTAPKTPLLILNDPRVWLSFRWKWAPNSSPSVLPHPRAV